MPRYVLDIIIQGTDRASPKIGRFNRTLSRIAQIASGIVVAGAIRGLATQITNLGRTAIDSFSRLERMEVGIQSLVARELAAGQTIQIEVLKELALSEKQVLALDTLIVERHELNEELSEATQEYHNLVQSEGAASISTLAASVAMRELQGELEGVNGEISELEGVSSGVATIMQEQRVNTMSLADALEAAKQPAEQLTDWVVRLALTSPFKEDDITTILRLAAGYGLATQTFSEFGTEQEQIEAAQRAGVVTAQRFTAAQLDFVAALGLESEDLVRVSRGLLQVQAKGKLAGEEIRQLTNAGVGIDLMARAMGLTVKEFTNLQKEGKILARDFIPALVELIEKDLAGASERMALTVGGTLVNMRELVEVLSRTVAGPLLTAIGPGLREAFAFLSSEEFMAGTQKRGEAVVTTLTNIWNRAIMIRDAFARTQNFFTNPWEIILAVTPADWDISLKRKIADIALDIGKIDLGFEDGNAAAAGGAIDGISIALGVGGLLGAVRAVAPILLRFLPMVLKFLGPIGIAAGILGAAWSGNWLGMRDILTEAWEKPGGIKETLESIRTWVEEGIPLALAELKRVWETEFIPALQAGWDWINENLIPTLREWGTEILSEIAQASADIAIIWSRDLQPAIETFISFLQTDGIAALITVRDVITGKQPLGLSPGLQEVADNINNNVIPAMGEMADFLRDTFKGDVEAVRDALLELADDTMVRLDEALNIHGVIIFNSLSRVIEERLGPSLETVDLLFGRISTFGMLLAALILPALEDILLDLSALFEESVVPLFSEWVGLLGDVADIILSLVTGAFVNLFIPALENMWDILDSKLNGALSFFNDLLKDISDNTSPLIVIAVMGVTIVLFLLKQAVGRVRGAVDWLIRRIKALRELLDSITLPWWALERSPSPAEKAFRNIADALIAVNDAAMLPGVSNLDRIQLQHPSQFGNLARVQSGGTNGPMVVEGDRNVFNVDSDSQARLVGHMLRESKIKRVNEWMNR